MSVQTVLKPGVRLRSQVCTTEVIIVRPGAGRVELTCGGRPMVELTATADMDSDPVQSLLGGTTIGKRYTASADETVEVLVTKAGQGTLADGVEPLIMRTAKTLPASD